MDSAPHGDIMEFWNDRAIILGLRRLRLIGKSRQEKLRNRWREWKAADPDGALAFLEDVMEEIKASGFLRGENDRNWKVTFDWLIENDRNAVKVAEGQYRNGEKMKWR
ncbi:unnamed protein product [marine sediment metagenome]|uniref:Uncharacterized protein n=1 Tax=marine sediment metagenome TaxID=412755 RepID=X1HNG7_9ZZZZ